MRKLMLGRGLPLPLFAVAVIASAVPAHAVALSYAPKVGVTVKHKLAVKGRTEAGVEGVDQTMRIEMTGVMQYSETAVSETQDQVRVETLSAGGKFTVKMGGQTQSQDVPKGKVVADMDRHGRLVKLVSADRGGKSSPQDMMGGNWANFSDFGTLPEGDVKVGEVWRDEVKIPGGDGEPEINLKLTSRLMQLATFEGRKCAMIRTNFRGPLKFEESGEEGDSGSMEAMLQGDVVWHYDYENSVYVEAEGTVGMDMKMAMSGPESPGMHMTTKMLMNVKMSLVK